MMEHQDKYVEINSVGELCITCSNGDKWLCNDGKFKILCHTLDRDTNWNGFCSNHSSIQNVTEYKKGGQWAYNQREET